MSLTALDLLREQEFSRIVEQHPSCPSCGAFKPMDPANPRHWELHREDCRLQAAIAELEAAVAVETDPAPAAGDPQAVETPAPDPVADTADPAPAPVAAEPKRSRRKAE